ncbi:MULTISPECIES: TetR/AcrR family transcriptional regulator [Paenibacillus]|uniref:TetR/AcrR family transcriptional regulator n=1 Tax=Paenibacillus TaxID=44249 RepID=UPI0007BF5E63|nr:MULTISPECIES: TetR/AcrR family transcriptional regulator [Paenibacillus]OAX48470.1 Transposon Tn10 TetC protein [Paenibacillus sp. AD87]WDQ31078.1 TetR/AcrR family transcriptional regulator [Paenibacillus marchantiae]SHN59654.1 transcriptional regulator, TetR family [Paenibacillus sp. ov031]
MRNINPDLRVIRTKESIRQALVELINEKGFKAITVKDITTKANINRGTFYAHYQDKFDLMTKCEEEIMLDMSRITKQNYPSVIAALESDSEKLIPFSLTVSIFEYLNLNGGFMKAVLGPNGDLTFQTRLKQFMWETLYGNNPNSFVKEENLLVPGQYLAAYMGTAIIGVIQQWLESGTKETPQEMARILTTISVNGPFYAAGLKK